MSTLPDKVTALLSTALRASVYAFLRWFPGHHFPPLIATLFALYVPSFLISFLTKPKYEVLAEDLDVKITEPVDESPSEGSTRKAEKIEVEETVIVQKRPKNRLRTLAWGIPSPTSNLWSLLTLLLNLVLIGFVADFVYRVEYFHPTDDLAFTRVGYVDGTSAKILVREPDESKYPIRIRYKIHNPLPPYDPPFWNDGGGVNFATNETDFTAVLTIKLDFTQARTWYYETSNGHNGTFVTPPTKPGRKTFKGDDKFTFVTSSCIKPHFPYNPLDHPLSMPGFKHLAKWLPSLGAQFMLFLGDFIYIDVPRRFGTSVEDYRREYRQVYASPDWPSVGQNLSWIHVIDDHEIANDWDSNTTGIYRAAIEPFNLYHARANPPPARKSDNYAAYRDGASYYSFTQGPASFFMIDTRKFRDPSGILPANSTEKTMLGKTQLDDLLAWIANEESVHVGWKILVSSIPFTKNWRVNSLDTWAGYLAERQTILEAMWDASVAQGVGFIVLSGDRHEFAATAFPPPAGGKWPSTATVHEFSTSPLNQFYLPIPTYKQEDDEDVKLKYIPNGQSKFGAVTIETLPSGDQSTLTFTLFVDGVETWAHVLVPPMSSKKNSAAGWVEDLAQLSTGGIEAFKKWRMFEPRKRGDKIYSFE